jgi:hypothetical protein
VSSPGHDEIYRFLMRRQPTPKLNTVALRKRVQREGIERCLKRLAQISRSASAEGRSY